MGVSASIAKTIQRTLFTDKQGEPCEEVPACYLREDDYSMTGILRSGAQQKWVLVLYSMIHIDLQSRLLLWPIIQKRMDRMEASLKYTNCDLDQLMHVSKWSEKNIFEAHDLFQAFEVDGDGLIEIIEMSVGLDNLGDVTSREERIAELSSGDEDGTGSIDFVEFLQMLANQQRLANKTSLAVFFSKVNEDVKMIRWMSTVQQIHAGYL